MKWGEQIVMLSTTHGLHNRGKFQRIFETV